MGVSQRASAPKEKGSSMDEVREKWEELRLLLMSAQQASVALLVALENARPDKEFFYGDEYQAWLAWADKHTELDYDLWGAYCHAHQAPWRESEGV